MKKEIVVIGAGIMGCMVAKTFMLAGYSVTIIDDFKLSNQTASKLASGIWRDTWYMMQPWYRESLELLTSLGIKYFEVDTNVTTFHKNEFKRSIQLSYEIHDLSQITLYQNADKVCDTIIHGKVNSIVTAGNNIGIRYYDLLLETSEVRLFRNTPVVVCAGYKTLELLSMPNAGYSTTEGVTAWHKGNLDLRSSIYNIQPHKNIVVRGGVGINNDNVLVRFPWDSTGEIDEDAKLYQRFINWMPNYSKVVPNTNSYGLKYGTRLHANGKPCLINAGGNLYGICGTGKDTTLLSPILARDLLNLVKK